MKKILFSLLFVKIAFAQQQSPPFVQIYSTKYTYTGNGFNITVHPNIEPENLDILPRYSTPNYTTHYTPYSDPSYTLVYEDNFDNLNTDFWNKKNKQNEKF